MNISPKVINTQAFRLMLYCRPLHPELFELNTRRTDRQSEYDVESWMIPAGHVLRFQSGGANLTEVVVEAGDHLPESGLLHALPCIGEKDFELEAEESPLGYVTTIQTETLTDNLYAATLKEMEDFVSETGSLSATWLDGEGTPCLTVLDTQKYKHEFHLQSYHLLGSSGVVLRTQSIFETP